MAVAVSVTAVVFDTVAEQTAGQLIPPTSEVTDPDPEPFTVTAMVGVAVGPLNVAVTAVAAFIVTLQVPTPVHPPPDHPANALVAVGVAANVTTVP